MLLHSLSHLILRTTPWIRQDNYYYDFHFINEETEGQKVKWFNESHTVDMWQNHVWSSLTLHLAVTVKAHMPPRT